MTLLVAMFVVAQILLVISCSAIAKQLPHRRKAQQIFVRNDAALSSPPSEPTDSPTQSPTDIPTFSQDFFQKTCDQVSSNYAEGTCDCSSEDQNIICELSGSERFPFRYVLLEYDVETGKIVKGSECYCQNEVNCGKNADDYCLSMALIDSQKCAITFLADGAVCSNACQPCVDETDSYGLNIDACFTGGTPNGCISMEIAGQIGENYDRNMAPPDFIKACDEVVATYPDSTCKCFAENLRMECSLESTTEFQNVFLSFLYDSNTTKVNEGLKCFCQSSECGQNAADYCISVSLVGAPSCNITLIQTNQQLVDCCDVCNSPDHYGVNTNECFAVDQADRCFVIDIDKDSGENHAMGTSEVPSSSVAPTLAPSKSATPTSTPSFSPSMQPSAGPSISSSPTKSPTPQPTRPPVIGTASPTLMPSAEPSFSSSPSHSPTGVPSFSPTAAPFASPSASPTDSPSLSPVSAPTLRPTLAPTRSPSVEKSFELSPAQPTKAPASQGPTVETQSTTIVASGDTFIYKSGLVSLKPTGNEATMLVQNGPEANPEIPDAYALISFEIGSEFSLQTVTTSRTAPAVLKAFSAQLCLQHVENNSPDAVSTTLTVCRIDISQMNGLPSDADTMTSNTASFSMPEDCVGKETMMIDFEVSPDDSEICIEVLQVLVSPPETSSQNTRQLVPEETLNGKENVLFMIDSIHTEKSQGDLFYTKDSGARSPKIIINHSLSAPSTPPSLQPTAVTAESSLQPVAVTPETLLPTSGLTLLSGDKAQSASNESGKNKNALYSLFLLLLIIPIVWVVIRRRNIRSQYEGQAHMDHDESQHSYNHEEREIGNFDEEEVSALESFPAHLGMDEEASGLESFPGHPGMYFTDRKNSVDGEIYEDRSSVQESSACDSSAESSDATGSCPW